MGIECQSIRYCPTVVGGPAPPSFSRRRPNFLANCGPARKCSGGPAPLSFLDNGQTPATAVNPPGAPHPAPPLPCNGGPTARSWVTDTHDTNGGPSLVSD